MANLALITSRNTNHHMSTSEYLTERWLTFWMNVNVPDDTDACWEWTGFITPSGHGQFWYGKDMRASRAVWIMYHDSIKPTDYICHKISCSNPKCVRLEHLYKGTHTSNQRDEALRGTRKNDKAHYVKLDWEKVAEIRSLQHIPAPTSRKNIQGTLPKGMYSSAQVAGMFGISSTTVLRVWSKAPKGGWRKEVSPNGQPSVDNQP